MSTGKNVQSFGVAATLSAYRGVAVTANNTVGYPAAATALPIGVTIDDVLETTQGIAVAVAGSIVPLYFNDTVAAAGVVAIDSSGRGIPFVQGATHTADNCYIGVLVGAAVSATGTIANILVNPGIGG